MMNTINIHNNMLKYFSFRLIFKCVFQYIHRKCFLIEVNEKGSRKKNYSPSNPLNPYYYLVVHDGLSKYQVVGDSSVQKINNDKAFIDNILGEVQIITSGEFLFT